MKLRIVLAALVLVTGCNRAKLPAGAISNNDAVFNATLQTAHAAVEQYEADVKSGKHTPTAGEGAAVNAVVTALNVADPLEQAYHASGGSTSPTALVTAVANVSTAVANLEAILIPKKGN